MKRKLTLLICCTFLFSLLFCLPAHAAQKITVGDGDMALYLPNDFTVLTQENAANHEALLKEYNTTVTATQLKIEKEQYTFLAISPTMECTVYLSARMDSVSATVGDLITYEQKDLAKGLLLGKTLPENAKVQELEQRGALFYRVDFGMEKGIGRILYVTVMNGTLYTLGLTDNSGTENKNTPAMFDEIFKTWEYTIHAEAEKVDAFKAKLNTVLFWVFVPIGLVVLGFMLKRMITELKEKEAIRKRQKNIPKKPRR